jgi:hypothetical protein
LFAGCRKAFAARLLLCNLEEYGAKRNAGWEVLQHIGSNSSAPSLWTDSTSSASSADWASMQQQTAHFLDRCACAPRLPGDFVLRLQDTAHLEIRLITLHASRRAPYFTGQAAIFMSTSFIFALRTASV